MQETLAAFLYVRGLVPEDTGCDQIMVTSDRVRSCLLKLNEDLNSVTDDWSEDQIQSVFYEAGKLYYADKLRWWFEVLYQVLLSEPQGPRLGQFTRLMSAYWVQGKIEQVLSDYWQSCAQNKD